MVLQRAQETRELVLRVKLAVLYVDSLQSLLHVVREKSGSVLDVDFPITEDELALKVEVGCKCQVLQVNFCVLLRFWVQTLVMRPLVLDLL